MEQFFHRMHVRKETIRRQTKAIKDQWKRDESEGFPGSCEFKVKYLGYTEVYESKGADICRQSFQRLKYDDLGISLTHIFQKSRRRLPSLSGQPLAKFHISSDGIRITDEDENIIVETPISSVTFCCPNSQHERGFTFICRGDVPWKWHCHAVEAADDHGERLNNAVGCAFTICLEKKLLSKRQNAAGSFTATDEHQDGIGRPLGEIRRLSIADLQAPQPPESNGSDLFPRNISDSTMNRSIDRPRAPLELRNRKGSLGNMMEAYPYKRRFPKDNVPEEEMELRDTSDEQPTFF